MERPRRTVRPPGSLSDFLIVGEVERKPTLISAEEESSTKIEEEKIVDKMVTPSGVQMYKCTECKARYRSKVALLRHAGKHSGEKPFVCPECGKGLSSQCSLSEHLNIHTNNRPHRCDECGLESRQLSVHLRHLLTHQASPDRVFKCSICSRTFKQSEYLRRHMRKHTGEKPFLCSECGKAFTCKSELNRHGKRHTSERPHCCPECGRSFKMRHNLRAHIRAHEGTQQWKCLLCPAVFPKLKLLEVHRRIHQESVKHLHISRPEHNTLLVYTAGGDRRRLPTVHPVPLPPSPTPPHHSSTPPPQTITQYNQDNPHTTHFTKASQALNVNKCASDTSNLAPDNYTSKSQALNNYTQDNPNTTHFIRASQAINDCAAVSSNMATDNSESQPLNNFTHGHSVSADSCTEEISPHLHHSLPNTTIPDTNLGSSSQNIVPVTTLGSSSQNIVPITTLGSSSHNIVPVTTLGSSSRNIVPVTTLGSSSQNIVPVTTLGSSSQNIVPVTTLGSSFQNIVPATTLGSSSQNIVPVTTLGSSSQNIVPETTLSGSSQNIVIPRTSSPVTISQKSKRNKKYLRINDTTLPLDLILKSVGKGGTIRVKIIDRPSTHSGTETSVDVGGACRKGGENIVDLIDGDVTEKKESVEHQDGDGSREMNELQVEVDASGGGDVVKCETDVVEAVGILDASASILSHCLAPHYLSPSPSHPDYHTWLATLATFCCQLDPPLDPEVCQCLVTTTSTLQKCLMLKPLCVEPQESSKDEAIDTSTIEMSYDEAVLACQDQQQYQFIHQHYLTVISTLHRHFLHLATSSI